MGIVTGKQCGNFLLSEPFGGMQPMWCHTENSVTAMQILTLQSHHILARTHVCLQQKKRGDATALDCSSIVLLEESHRNR